MRRVLSFVLLCGLFACNSISKRLDQIEQKLWVDPKSALTDLQDDNLYPKCRSSRDKALFALLTCIALDKNYIDVNSDSLSHIALEYYRDHNDLKRKMLSWYYNGIAHKNAGNYQEAIIDFEQSEKYAIETGDLFYQGLSSWRKGDLFTATNNNTQSIEYYKLAVNCFSEVDAPRYYQYAKLALAQCLANAKLFNEADSVIQSFLVPQCDNHLSGKLQLLQAQIMLEQNAPATETLQLYEDVSLDTYEMLDYSLHGLAYERNGQRDSADCWITMAYKQAVDWADSATIDVQSSLIAYSRKEYEKAYHLLDNVIQAQDSITRIILQQSISTRQRDYYIQETAEKEHSYRRLLQIIALIGSATLLFIALIVLLFELAASKKNQQIKDQMAALILSKHQLQESQKNNALLAGSLFRDKFLLLNKISSQYFYADNNTKKDIVFKTFKQQLLDLRNNNILFDCLEQDLNSYCDNIMQRLRVQVPAIKDKNIHIIALFFAGAPYRVVQLISGAQSIEALKTKKTRFRKTILDANAPDAQLFLKMLEIRKNGYEKSTNEEF